MKYVFSIVFLLTFVFSSNKELFEVKENTSDKLVLTFKMQEYSISEKDNYSIISIPGSGTRSQIGEPNLPSLSSFIKLDKNYTYDISYTIKSQKEINDINIKPLQSFDNNQVVNFKKNDLIYSSSSSFPSSNINESERFSMRGTEFINVDVTPFTYSPSTQKLNIIEELEISVNKKDYVQEPISKDFPNSKVFDRLINSLVVNPTYNDTRNEDYQQPHILYICGGNSSTNYYMNELVQWRRKQGYKVTVVSTSVTGNGSNEIRNYLEESMNWPTPPEFVTLVGDTGGNFSIGSFTEYDSGYYGEGDHPFSQLDGNDLWPEVVLGRISVRSTSELAVVVTKILGYEQASNMDDNWFEKARIVGDPSTSGISCAITAENIAETMEDYGMQDVDLKVSGGNYDDYMEDALSEGVNYLNYRGYYGVSGFGNNNVDGASSPGFRLPFATIITCGTGSFASENECLSEKFLRAGSTASPKGAIACIGTATIGTHTMFNNAVNIGIYYGIFSNNLQTAGEALVAGKATLYETYPSNPNNWVTIFTYWNNLMGDAASTLWTGEPSVIDTDYNSSLSAGQNYLDVNVTVQGNTPVNQPLENALVTLIDGRTDGFYNQGYTDELGNVTLNFDPSEITGELSITVTKFGHKPHMGTLSYDTEHVPYASSDSVIIDGNVTAGETLNLNVPIFYNGTNTFNDVVATLTTDGSVNLINDQISYETIANGSNFSDQSFVVEVTELQDHNSDINFFITLNDDAGNEFVTNINFNVESFEINIIDAVIVNDNNNNGRLDPGESSNILLNYENIGAISSPQFSCTLSTVSEDFSIEANEVVNLIPIQPGTNSNSSSFTQVNLDDTAFNGETKTLDILCSTDSGYEINISKSLLVGQTTSGDTTLDEYGYYIYDFADSNYSLMPTYEWIDIEDSGNPLNDVNDDDGDNQDEVQTISLPFNFNFYGLTYEEISVSSNGWISFGETELESFRNDHLPGPAGPSPMLAVFWDDLTADSGGEVFSYYDDILNVFIIQWNNVKTYEDNTNESFQAILFDPQYYTTPTGDGEILLQYEDFNNTSNGSYGGGTPLHGGYCSIGIEDHTGLRGIEYTFNNSWARTASPLVDGTALFISTRKTGSVFNMAQPELALSNNSFDFEIIENEIQTESLTLSNDGEDQSILTFDITSTPFSVTNGSDNFGNYWTDSDSESISYNWIDIDPDNSTLINFETNDQGVNLDLESEINFYGNTYNQLIINPNGWVGFSGDNTEWSNTSLPNSNAPNNAIFGFWDDLNPINENPTCSNEAQGNVYYTSTDNAHIVWYDNVIRCGSNEDYAATVDFQIVMYDNQKIEINYRSMDGYLSSATIGIQNDNASDFIQVVYNSNYIENELSLSIKPLPSWLTSISDQQQLSYQDQVTYNVIVDGGLVNSDTDVAYLIINSNSTNPTEIIPINVLSTPDPGLVGDINGDDIINVLDVVVLVNLVLSSSEYSENADINNDGILNVLDIVGLVNIVLNS